MLFLAPASLRAEDRGALAVTDPQALRVLEARHFGLAQMLAPGSQPPISNDALFALPAMASVLPALEQAFDNYLSERRVSAPDASVGVGSGHDVLLFDKAQLAAPDTRFALASIVNRMDRAYVAPERCGEVRLIYRLSRFSDGQAPQRLPMTLNLVLHAQAADQHAATCADVARRWLSSSKAAETGSALADRLTATDGALAGADAAQIDRLEINLQIAHQPASELRDFRTDYLQKVFRFDIAASQFREAPMENQIDRNRLLVDAALGQAFKDWLLAPQNLRAFDRGTVLIPEQFLATVSVASTPAGFAPSALQPTFGLMAGENGTGLFAPADIVAALARATADGGALATIRSPAGFARRLNDITCGGCHQVRGIGGFHVIGADTLAPQTVQGAVIGSPHFFGDQPRRRAIVMAMRDGQAVDFSRGFADRPQARGSTELAGTSAQDGWGATCYRRDSSVPADASFAGWNCADGLTCQPVGGDTAARIGMCFVK